MKNKPLVRTLADADPNFAAAKALVDRLRAAASKLDAEEHAHLHALATRPPVPEKTGRVAVLLGDAAPDDDAAPDGVRARLKAIAAERVDIRAAIDIATQRLTAARHAASAKICAEVRPEYARRVMALAAALLASHAAHVELLALIEELKDNDIAWAGTLPPLQATGILGHESGRVAGWLREAADAGFIEKTKIPKELVA